VASGEILNWWGMLSKDLGGREKPITVDFIAKALSQTSGRQLIASGEFVESVVSL